MRTRFRHSVPIIETDGNAYGVIGKVGKALIAAGHRDAAARWVDDATSSGSYDAMLRIALATVRFE